MKFRKDTGSFRAGGRTLWPALACMVLAFFCMRKDGLADSAPAGSLAAELETVDLLRREGRYPEALERLQGLLEKHPEPGPSGRAEVLWRQSWTKVDLGESSDGESAMRALYEGALEDAKAAVAADGSSAQAHLVCAISAGRLALVSPVRRKIELSRKVKEHADLAIACDPDLSSAYHVRAMWHREVAAIGGISRVVLRLVYGGMPETSYAAAVADFERAIELEEYVGDRVELARTYQAMGESGQARRELERALALPARTHQDRKYRETARQMRSEL